MSHREIIHAKVGARLDTRETAIRAGAVVPESDGVRER